MTAAGNLLLLGLLYLVIVVIGYGLLSTVRFGVARLLSQLALSAATVTTGVLVFIGGLLVGFGLYYAIAVLTDATYRAQFLDRLNSELEATFNARRTYRELVRR